MNELEKLLFIDFTCIQFGKIETSHPEFFETWYKLSEAEKDEYSKLNNEVRVIWNYINLPVIVPVEKRVYSVFEYDELINPVSKMILLFCKDFGITFKDDFSDEFKIKAKRLLGNEYFDFFES